ncbi:MAG TPA: DUF2249 domain-containing protein [Herpetosiphonaceae bacterium]
MITPSMTVADVLARHPQALAVFVAQHPSFARLRSPALRKTLARLVTVGQAAGIAHIDAGALVAALNAACGAAPAPEPPPASESQAGTRWALPPDWLVPARICALLDVRGDQGAGRPPLAAIQRAVQPLAPGETALLRSAFEPVPLYDLLARRGFACWGQRRADDDWLVFVTPAPAVAGTLAEPPVIALLDQRGLTPPEPMTRTLAEVRRLAATAREWVVLALTDRQPALLWEALDEQGYDYVTRELGGEGYWTRVSAGVSGSARSGPAL